MRMNPAPIKKMRYVAVLSASFLLCGSAHAGLSAEELAKLAQNPVGNLVSVPCKIFHLGKLPVNTQLSAYYNVVTPDDGPNLQIRAQVQFMFPK